MEVLQHVFQYRLGLAAQQAGLYCNCRQTVNKFFWPETKHGRYASSNIKEPCENMPRAAEQE